MSSKLHTFTIDCADPPRLADFWSAALGYSLAWSNDEEVAIAPADGTGATLLFLRVPDRKTVKNRFHLDLNPDDQQAEVRRLVDLGATRADIGQGDASWVVLADPEGNEFCVLTSR